MKTGMLAKQESPVKKDRATALQRAAVVYRAVSRKESVTYKVANSKRRNTSKPYDGNRILDIFETDLPEYIESFQKAVSIIGSPPRKRQKPKS